MDDFFPSPDEPQTETPEDHHSPDESTIHIDTPSDMGKDGRDADERKPPSDAEDAPCPDTPEPADDGGAESGLEPVVGSRSYREMTIAELARDKTEIAAFAKATGIDPEDPHPGAESLRVASSLFDAGSKLGGVLLDQGEALCARLDMGTAERALASAQIERARDSLSDATGEFVSARDALGNAAEALVDRTGSAAAALQAGIQASSSAMAQKSAELLAGQLGQVMDSAFTDGQNRIAACAEQARERLVSELGSGAERFAERLLKQSKGEVKTFEAAMARALAEADRKALAANPWRWRLLAIAMAGLVASMGLSWMIGHDLGSKTAQAMGQTTAMPRSVGTPIIPRGR